MIYLQSTTRYLDFEQIRLGRIAILAGVPYPKAAVVRRNRYCSRVGRGFVLSHKIINDYSRRHELQSRELRLVRVRIRFVAVAVSRFKDLRDAAEGL